MPLIYPHDAATSRWSALTASRGSQRGLRWHVGQK
jgi:hypothetical protein